MTYGLVRIARDAALGKISYASDEKQRTRLAICSTCDKFNPTMKVCKECGCFLPGKIKFEQSSCPLQKW